MSFHWDPHEQVLIGRYLFKWSLLGLVVGVLSGTASAVFLVSLNWATDTRVDHPWLLYLLPVGGCLIGLAYHYWWRGLESGNNLLLEEIHQPGAGVPARLAPAILLATIGTHLFGGSAGREGTAVQMGGSLAAWFARLVRLDPAHTRTLLMAGISGGFASVFGTPLAGAVFGLEVLAVGRLRYDALIPCLIAAVIGDWTCNAWGVLHTHYIVVHVPEVTVLLCGKIIVASLAFALAAVLFAEITHWLGSLGKRYIAWAPGRPVIGGLAVIALTWLVGTRDYLGLGIPMIVQSFQPEGVATWAFFWKIVFTAVTLGFGFKGGEVTPLFFIGATLGCSLAPLLGLPTDFLAALGFVAVFAGAANTPLACTLMGVELFGAPLGVALAIACCSTYVWSGHRGIYLSQQVDTPKTDDLNALTEVTLGTARSRSTSRTWSFLLSRFQQVIVPTSADQGEPSMETGRSPLTTHKLGLLRIYLKTQERNRTDTWVKRLVARPLYQEIIDQAHQAGLKGATAKTMHYGYANHGEPKSGSHPELGHTAQNVYVELIDTRDKLEAFIGQIAEKVKDRVIVFNEVEFWDLSPKEPQVADRQAAGQV